MPNPAETAVLNVGGLTFDAWESVWVQHRWSDSFQAFRFTAAEDDKMPENWTKAKFKPCDKCTITLGGQLAITGHILSRQTAYNETSHSVQLIGKSLTVWSAQSSVDTKTGNFDGMSFEQIARKVLQPYPCGVKKIGKLDDTPFESCQAQKGETIWDFLENLARPRGIVLGSDVEG